MPLYDPSRLEIKLGDYAAGNASALYDSSLLPRVQEHRRGLSTQMRAVDGKDLRKHLPEKDDFLVSRKVDGEFSVLIFDGNEAVLLNPGGTLRTGLPSLREAAVFLAKGGVKSAMLACELYVDRPDGKRPRVHDVVTVARKPTSAAEVASLKLAIFDILDLDGQIDSAYAARWGRITKLLGAGKSAHPVETRLVTTSEEAAKCFTDWVEGEGAEGLVVRCAQHGAFKVKSRHTLDVAVVGFSAGIEDRTNMLHDLLLAVVRPEGTFHLLGRVGGGFTDEQRREFLADLKDMEVGSDYAEINSDRVAYRMVKPQWVAEISVLDLITSQPRSGSIDKMVLDWDSAANHWRTVRRLPLVATISPQFIRLRTDKQSTAADVPLRQLTDLVDISFADQDARTLKLPGSEIIRREVRTKTLKGAKMVRKIVLWKTNKETMSEDFPAYVLYLTDYSPNRATPLERDIAVSNSREQIDGLMEKWMEENFVKGWV